VRELSEAEFRTARSILALPDASERERIRNAGLPSSTYNVARRRLLAEGWMSEVLVPNPGPAGFHAVEFRLARPPASSRASLMDRWEKDPDCTVLWSGVHAVFGIFFRRSGGDGRKNATKPAPDGNDVTITVGRGSGSVPAYFDYAGLWATFGDESPPPGYPRGLDFTSGIPSSGGARRRHALRAAALHELPAPGSGWLDRLRWARSQRPLLAEAILQRRTVLLPERVPPRKGRRIGELIFIWGPSRRDRSPHELVSRLVRECGVGPFLAAEAQGTVLLAGLGQLRSSSPGRVPVPSARRPVLPLLLEYLEPAEVLVEPIEAVQARIHHRYPRDFPSLTENPQPRSMPSRLEPAEA
jgi:hypothetical protein